MKKTYLKIVGFVLIGAIILFIPVSLLLSTALAADARAEETAESTEKSDEKQEIIPLPKELEDYGTGLTPTQYTPETYVQPKYDPFNNKFGNYNEFKEKVEELIDETNAPPLAKFTVRNSSKIADKNSATVSTKFEFGAYSSYDSETRPSKLKVRWDFESDGEWDSYFSRNKTVIHAYEEPGVYTVTLEVLDSGGLTSRATKEVTVVENTKPFAYFSYKPATGTTNKIFNFDTSESDDSQYRRQYLEYRFDWNGDGKWDTPYDNKRTWRHKFDDPGVYHVIMEVKDPEDATSLAESYIEVTENIPPTASFSMEVKPFKVRKDEYRDKYYFDASYSTDTENPDKLQYRWDFNYTGPNDINFTTGFRTSSKYSGMYDFPGEKTVRLQVRDEDGAVNDAFINISVSE